MATKFTRNVEAMAVVNLRMPEEMKRKLAGLAKATGASQTEMVKSAVAEKLTIHEVARAESNTSIPSWVPEGKYVALVRGAVAAVGDSVAEVVSAALTKFPDDAIHVARKGRAIKAVHYTFLAQALDVQEYQLTRLLQKLERNRYIKREQRGKEKLVKLIDEAPT